MFVYIKVWRSRLQGGALPLLLCMGLLDELATGLPIVALPLLRDHLGFSYTQAGLLFTAGAISSLILEPFINLFSAAGSKKPWILAGLLCLVITEFLFAQLTSYIWLLLTFVLYYPAIGTAIGLSQAALIDAAPEASARTMTRWTLLSGIGDCLAPLCVAGFAALDLGWVALCWFVLILWAGTAVALALLPFPRPALATQPLEAEDESSARSSSLWSQLGSALRDPALMRWTALATIPMMLDEIFLGFVALYLRDVLHMSESLIALILTMQMGASLLGLFLLDLLLQRRVMRTVPLLALLATGTLAGMIGVLLTHLPWLIIASLSLVSLSCAGWYPLAQGEAYAQRPGNAGLVRVVTGLGDAFEIVLPGLLGLVASTSGLWSSLAILGLAPILTLLLLPYRSTK